jgi:hypothetical protein
VRLDLIKPRAVAVRRVDQQGDHSKIKWLLDARPARFITTVEQVPDELAAGSRSAPRHRDRPWHDAVDVPDE